MDKLKLKVRLSNVIDQNAVMLSMLIAHDKKQTKAKRKLALKVLKAYNIRKVI